MKIVIYPSLKFFEFSGTGELSSEHMVPVPVPVHSDLKTTKMRIKVKDGRLTIL
jgi:hypothetical protein